MTPVIHGLSGNSVETAQWESGNLSTRFPFEDDSGPSGYPFDAIVDACVVAPSEFSPSTGKVFVGCLHRSREMVSVMLYSEGGPVLHSMVLRSSFEPFSPVMLEPVRAGYSGFVSFGDIRFDDFRTPEIRRDMVPLSEAAVVRPVVGRLRRFIQPASGEEAHGIVGIVVPNGVEMVNNPPEGHTSRITFSLGETARKAVFVSCDEADPSEGGLTPIYTINGVHPDEDGRIAVVFARSKDEVPE